MDYQCGYEGGGKTFNDQWLIEQVYPGITDGFYVEVGAGSWKAASTSYCLEQLGWRGISIEPHPDFYADFTKMRKNPCLHAALAGEDGEADFVMPANKWYSGLVRNITKAHEEIVYSSSHKIVRTRTISFKTVLKDCPSLIHVISMDIEGSELECLRQFPFATHQVGCFIIENSNPHITPLLESKGYERTTNPLNEKAPWEIYLTKPAVVEELRKGS